MTKIDLQYDLVNYTPASASPVEANFDRTEQHINQELIERDGTVAMRAQLKLVGDPVAELDAAPKQYVDQVLPIGIVMMFGGSSVPPGGRWAICNGAELQTATYPALYAVIGTNFGGASGRFNLPNLVDRFPMGNGGLAAIGATGGNRDNTLVAHQHGGGVHSHGLESHIHGMKSHVHHFNHAHGIPGVRTGGQTADHYHLAQNGHDSILMSSDNGNPEFILGDGGRVLFAGHTNWSSGDHQHDVPASTTVYNTQAGSVGVGASDGNTQGPNDNASEGPSGYGGPQAAGILTDSQGVAATNANLPPYVGMAYIMRVL